MLCLTLRKDDSIVVGDSVRFVFLGKSSDGAYRIGVEAPTSLKILRDKLLTLVDVEGLRECIDKESLAAKIVGAEVRSESGISEGALAYLRKNGLELAGFCPEKLAVGGVKEAENVPAKPENGGNRA